MVAATITKTTLISQAHKNIFSLIDNRSLIHDPRNVNTNSGRKFVYDFDPWHKSTTFDDTPYIIVSFPRLEEESRNLNGKQKILRWRQPIIIRTSYEGSANIKEGQGIQDMWDILDELHNLFNEETNKQTLREYNMFQLNLLQLETVQIDFQDNSLIETPLELTYYTKITVSS